MSSSLVDKVVSKCVAVLLYKPPVGIVAVAAIVRLILTGRLFRLYPAPPKDSIEEALQKYKRQKGRRCYRLDLEDDDYTAFGGVLRIRRQLLLEALDYLRNFHDADLLDAITDALSVSNPPDGTKAKYVRDCIIPLSRLETLQSSQKTADTISTGTKKIISISSLTAELRCLDALLRVCRDRVLETSFRLERTTQYWKNRVTKDRRGILWSIRKLFFRENMEADRLRLSFAEAAYKAEVRRLGEIASVLMDRPNDLEESFLLEALKSSDKISQQDIEMNGRRRSVIWMFPGVSLYSFRFRWQSNENMCDSSRKIDGSSAMDVLLSDPNADAWKEKAWAWTLDARTALCSVIDESLKASSNTGLLTDKELSELEQQWCVQSYIPVDDTTGHWIKILSYVDRIPSWHRIGEGRVGFNLRDAVPTDWVRRLDVFGIPSSLACVATAYYVHEWIYPHWPKIRQDAVTVFWKALEITKDRVWVPVKGIWDDLMNKNQGIFSAFGLNEEERSLDNMLRDLGFGDGTPATRQEALKKATEQYESDVSTNLFIHALQGRLARLMLVQVQQLKVGLLSALDNIDVLMKGNRIHFQILAAIPAVLMVTYGSRIFVRALYNIRSRDLRSVTSVHSEMAGYLDKMERLLLLAGREDEGDDDDDDDDGQELEGSNSRSSIRLTFSELGELLLYMHRYLILIEYTSPLFPESNCNEIHSLLQQLLCGTLQRLGTDRTLSWLHRIQQKHGDLLHHLS